MLCFRTSRTERSCASAAQTRIPGYRVKHSSTEPLRFSFFITTVHLHMVGRTSICTEQKRKLTLNVLLQVYMYTYAFIIHVTEYERLKIKIPVEGSFEFYIHFIPPLCLIIWFLNLIFVNYSPQYDDLQNP